MTALRALCARRPFAVALLSALALLLVPYRTLLGPGVPSGRDLLPYFYPLKTHLVEALLAGEMPWIDRFRQGGLPLLSWPGVAAFDPGNVLFLFLPTAAAAKAWMLLRVLTGAAGFAVFLRVSGLPPLSSALGALAWGASGITASAASFLGFASAHAALPWFAAALARTRARRDRASVALLGLATAFVLLPAVPEPLLAAALLALVLLAGRGPAPGLRERGSTALLWGAGGLLGASLAAPALGTLLVTGLESIRGVRGALLPEFAAQGALPVARLAELFADGIVADWTRTTVASGTPGYPYFPSLTPGRVAWSLALLGLLAGRGARLRASALAAIGILLALGPAAPLAGWLNALLPFGSAVRYAEKWTVLFGFGAVWLAALGAAVLESALTARKATVFAILGLLLAADRSAVTTRLVPLSETSLLSERPGVLAGIPPSPGDAPPPRVYSLSPLRLPAGARSVDPRLGGAEAAAWAVPWTGTRFGVASVLEQDYDAALPEAQLGWSLLLETAPPGGALAQALARAAGARGAVIAGRGSGGAPDPRYRPFADAVPPVRFVSRVLREPGPLASSTRFLSERAPVDTAVLSSPGAILEPSPGRVLRVSDRPSRLEIDVDVEGADPGYLLVCRPLVAAREATLDGRPVAVDDANVGFTGLAIPPGRHVVRLRPRTGWLIIPAVLAALSLATTFALLRRRRAGGPARS